MAVLVPVLSSEDLRAAIADAALERGRFAARLLPVVAELHPPISAAKVVEALTGHRMRG